MTHEDYEDLSDALIWHKQEKRITQERYTELQQILANTYGAYRGLEDIARRAGWTVK